MIKGYSFRFYRSGTYPYGWDIANMTESWCNGRKATGAADNTYASSGDYEANLLVVRRSDLGTFDIIGNQYLIRSDNTASDSCKASTTMALYEVLLYDEALTDAQIDEISAFLMKKWDVPQQVDPELSFGGSFAPASTFTVLADSTLDFSCYTPQMVGFKTVTMPSDKLPVLTFTGDWDVTALPLTVEGSSKSHGAFLRTTGILTSPFASVTGTSPDRVTYSATEAALRRAVGFMMSFH